MGGGGYGPGDHVCWVHDGPGSWHDVAASFLDDGARGGDRLLYVAAGDEAGLAEHLDGLPDRDQLLATGRLRLLPLSRSLAADGTFEAARHLAAYRRETLAAAALGYRTLRLAADVTALAATEESAVKAAAYELLVDAFVVKTGVSALCGYDGHVVDAAARHVSFVHPLRHDGRHSPSGALYADGAGRWRLRGELDVDAHATLRAALPAIPADGDVHLDCAGLDFADVGSVRELVVLAQRLAPTGRLVLHGPPRSLTLVLDVGFGDVWGLEVAPS